MNKAQQKKTKFRTSAKWKKFRHFKHTQQLGIDPITNKKLLKKANLHHLDLDATHYEDITQPENFVFLNYETHKVIHFLYTYYKKDPLILERFKVYLDKMVDLNS